MTELCVSGQNHRIHFIMIPAIRWKWVWHWKHEPIEKNNSNSFLIFCGFWLVVSSFVSPIPLPPYWGSILFMEWISNFFLTWSVLTSNSSLKETHNTISVLSLQTFLPHLFFHSWGTESSTEKVFYLPDPPIGSCSSCQQLIVKKPLLPLLAILSWYSIKIRGICDINDKVSMKHT